MTDEAGLHMIQMSLRTERLLLLGKRLRLPVRGNDEGYLIHCLLKELFGEDAPKPFALRNERGSTLSVLAYGNRSHKDLGRSAMAFALPEAFDACDWSRLTSKPMPAAWMEGQHLGFEVRLCPVVRMGSDGPHHRKGAEVDVFLARCFAAGDPAVLVDRETVYCEWLAERLEQGGAQSVRACLRRYHRKRLLRRSQGEPRTAETCERPDVVMDGVLEVRDPKRFQGLLRRGIGRHRAFGFGMLLLRRP